MEEFDFLFIGSGFGGSPAAMRLTQKGYRVGIIEKGRRWKSEEFPETNRNWKKYLWLPWLKIFGPQALSWPGSVFVLHGVGLGGGSLVYANTLMRPEHSILDKWPLINWNKELKTPFNLVEKMLGVRENTQFGAAEKALEEVAKKEGRHTTFHPTRIGVTSGPPGENIGDPYFNGKGPQRNACNYCGGCMVGCRHNAKNTLDKNYLYFAEKWGAKVFTLTYAHKIIPQNEGYLVITKNLETGSSEELFTKKLVLSAGVLGTLKILFKNKEFLNLPENIGNRVRTNGEALMGVTHSKGDYSHGVAIGASYYPDDNTRVEVVRYNGTSDFLKYLSLPFVSDQSAFKLFLRIVKKPWKVWSYWFRSNWAERTYILLAMGKKSLTLKMHHKWGVLRAGPESPGKDVFNVAKNCCENLGQETQGKAIGGMIEMIGKSPTTAHILGGVGIGHVVDENHKIYNMPGMYVVDGSVIPEDLGVNPSLTIAALSERFSMQFPVKDEELFSQRQL